MADIKTVTLIGDEVQVTIGRRHCHIRNLGNEMIYVSLKPGIVSDADGVLGIPAGTKDVLTNTDGHVYIKGTGKVQLVGSDYADGILGGLAGGDINAAVAAAVAKIVAGAPADFDTLKEISDWITSHSSSAAAMNSEIQTLKTGKADKSAIPTDYARNKRLTTLDEINNPNLESGIYDCGGKNARIDFLGIDSGAYVLIVNDSKIPSEVSTQIGIPYDHGKLQGIYYRIFTGVEWTDWKNVADGGNSDTVDGFHANEISSNPNLLINPDFRINQRGQTIYRGFGYTVDRWCMTNNNMTVSVVDDTVDGRYLECTVPADAEGHGYLRQYFEVPFSNTTITLSADIKGSGKCFLSVGKSDISNVADNIVSADAANTWTRITYTYDIPCIGTSGDTLDFADMIYLRVMTGSTICFKNLKAEYGNIATIFVPQDVATELLKCQRYFVNFNPSKHPAAAFGIGTGNKTTDAVIFLPLSVPMRSDPTVDYTGELILNNDYTENTTSLVTNITATHANSSINNIAVRVYADNVTPGMTYILRCGDDANGTITLDSEI